MGGECGREDGLMDRIGVGVLKSLVYGDMVEEVLEDKGRMESRGCLLWVRVVVYLVLEMMLFLDDGYEEVMSKLVDGMRFLWYWD